MRTSFTILGFVLGFFCLAHAEDQPISKEAQECFSWFGALGYPDVKGAPWAEVWTGDYIGNDPEPRKARTLHGFITMSEGDRFNVLTEELLSLSLTKSKPDTPTCQRVGYEERSFSSYAASVLETLQPPSQAGIHAWGGALDLKPRVFFLSYVCWVRGDRELAQKLFEEAVKISSHLAEIRQERDQSTRRALELEFENAAMWDTILLFGDLGARGGGGGVGGGYSLSDDELMPRRELLGVFRDFVRHFPETPHSAQAREVVRILEQMVAEDERHLVANDDVLAKMLIEDRIKELIFRLRDQHGFQQIQPGWCDIFVGLGGPDRDTPAYRLVKIGYPAVPQLIEALGDERFCRSVGFHRDFVFSHHVLTVGDCAQQILNRIAGWDFRPGMPYTYLSRDGGVAATRKAVGRRSRRVAVKINKVLQTNGSQTLDFDTVFYALYSCVMKTFSIMQTQHNLSEVLKVVESGQEVGITRRKQLVARILPAESIVVFPDFAERAHKVWSKGWNGSSTDALLDETRGDR